MGQTKVQKVIKQLSGGTVQKKTAIATDMFLPNHSGDHSAGIVNATPTKDTDLVNKKYVDDQSTAPGGNTTEVQFNDSGSFGGDTTFTFDKSINSLRVQQFGINSNLDLTDTDVGMAITARDGGTTRNWVFRNDESAGTFEINYKSNPTNPTDVTEAGYAEYLTINNVGKITLGDTKTFANTAWNSGFGGVVTKTLYPIFNSTKIDNSIVSNANNCSFSASNTVADTSLAGVDFYGYVASPKLAASGSTIDNMGGFLAKVRVTLGTATAVKLYDIEDATTGGTITTQYGYYCPDLVGGSTNWAFYSAGDTPSYFGGLTKQSGITQTFSGTKELTDGSATGFAEIAVGVGELVGGEILYTMYIDDGTDLQAHTGNIGFVAVNKAGTVTSDCQETYLNPSSIEIVTAGTLTDAATCTDGAGKITLNMNANTSLNVAIDFHYTIRMHSMNTITGL